MKARFWEFPLDSIADWINLPNTYSDRSDPFKNSSFNLFFILPHLDQYVQVPEWSRLFMIELTSYDLDNLLTSVIYRL